MPREVKYYEPAERRYFENNLQCSLCGNSTAFFIDLRLKHLISCTSSGEITVEFDKTARERIIPSLQRNMENIINKVYDTDKALIKCANCEEGFVDMQERLLDYCWQMGCPGCDVCGEYIDEEELRSLCSECITNRNGVVTEEDCYYQCTYYDEGLDNVRRHYNLSMDILKREVGY